MGLPSRLIIIINSTTSSSTSSSVYDTKRAKGKWKKAFILSDALARPHAFINQTEVHTRVHNTRKHARVSLAVVPRSTCFSSLSSHQAVKASLSPRRHRRYFGSFIYHKAVITAGVSGDERWWLCKTSHTTATATSRLLTTT